MNKKSKCTVLAITGILAMFGICIDSLGVAFTSMLIAILRFSSIAAINPEWGMEYDSQGRVIE